MKKYKNQNFKMQVINNRLLDNFILYLKSTRQKQKEERILKDLSLRFNYIKKAIAFLTSQI